MRFRAVLVVLSLVPLASSTQADMFTPSHSCSKPYKPYKFNSEWEIRQFQDDVEDYKQCISDFVEEQDDAVRKHQNAVQEAIDEWNSFVNYELR
jgi:hypothetical protein